MLGQEPTPLTIDPTTTWVLAGLGVALLAVVARELRAVPASLVVLMGTAFLDMAGVFLVAPLLVFWVDHFREQGVTIFGVVPGRGMLTGLVVTSYTVAQMLSAPWWGRYSDRHGRRPALLVALVASAAAYLLFGFADSLWVLVLSRVVQGLGGGTVGVIQAYVADSVPPEQRAKALGWLSAATNLGVTLGPVLGVIALGFGDLDLWPGAGAQTLGRAAPGVLAAVLCAVNVVFAWRYLPESRETKKKDAPISTGVALRRVFAQPDRSALRLLLTYGIAIGAAQGVTPTIVTFLKDRYRFDENTIGYYFMFIGAIAVFSRTLLLGRAIDRFGEALVSRVGVVTLVVGFALLPLTGSLPTLALAAALLPIGMALLFPCLTGQLSKIVSKDERGMYMGLQQTFGGASRLLAPNVYGAAMDWFGIVAPFWGAAAAVGLTLLFGAGRARPPATGGQLPVNTLK